LARRAEAATQARPELVLTKLLFTAEPTREISGFAWVGKALVAIADDATDHYIYMVDRGGKRPKVKPYLDFTKLQGWEAVVAAMKAETHVPEDDRRLDIEGVAACGDTKLYVINERVRQVYEIADKARIRQLPLDLSVYAELFAGGPNAGLEGIAVDCATSTMYLAKERDPRGIVAVELATGKVRVAPDVAASDRGNQKVINPFNGDGLYTISPDYSDLAFDGGYLYALERNTYEIAKIDPKTFAVVARVSYFKTEKPLYETGEPFGIAEALALTSDAIILGTDNNKTPISGSAVAKYHVRGNVPALMFFARPPGF
jgi:hypothetical protein